MLIRVVSRREIKLFTKIIRAKQLIQTSIKLLTLAVWLVEWWIKTTWPQTLSNRCYRVTSREVKVLVSTKKIPLDTMVELLSIKGLLVKTLTSINTFINSPTGLTVARIERQGEESPRCQAWVALALLEIIRYRQLKDLSWISNKHRSKVLELEWGNTAMELKCKNRDWTEKGC